MGKEFGEKQMPDNELFERFSRTYQAEEIILCEFVPGEEMYIIVSGHVKISKITKSYEKVLALLGPGDIIGEMAVINRKLRSATAVATEQTKVIGLTTENFEQIIARKPQLLVKLIQILCDRIWFTAQQVQNFTLKSAPGRVAGMLVLLGDSHKKKPDQNSKILLYTSPKDLSQMTGLELAEVENILNGFEKKEFIKIEEGLIILNDLMNIKATSEFYAKKEHFRFQGV
jgi:CRP/FNR family transcriptional regulator